jgi:ABC-type Na+ efflux pump permease subunit
MLRKELWDLKHSLRRWYWFVPMLALPLVSKLGPGHNSIPMWLWFALLPSLYAMAGSGQTAMDSILHEKQTKTLEVLLSTNMSPLSIILGKVILATAFGYLGAIVSLLELFAFFPESHAGFTGWSNVCIAFIGPLLLAYVAGCLALVTTILIPDEKAAPIVAITIIMAPLALLGYLIQSDLSPVGIALIAAVTLLAICLFATWLAAWALKRAPLITEI